MKVTIVPDSFKESLSSIEVARAIQEGWQQVFPHADYELVPMSDGGEGMLDALLSLPHVEQYKVDVPHPLMASTAECATLAHISQQDTISARYLFVPQQYTVVIESAEAIGLTLVPKELRNPLYTSSYGLGLMIHEAYEKFILSGKAHTILIGIGGTVTVDGGIGMAQALGARIKDEDGNDIPLGGQFLSKIAHIDVDNMLDFGKCRVLVASDVQNPLYGAQGAARIYGPQKGASPEIVEVLETGIHHYARVLAKSLSVDIHTNINFNAAGAAGGLGAALAVFCNAHIQSGIELMFSISSLKEKLIGTDLVITGEGRFDGQSMQGKLVLGVVGLCKSLGITSILIAGALDQHYERLYDYGVSAMFSSTVISTDWERIKRDAYHNLVQTARSIATMLMLGQNQI